MAQTRSPQPPGVRAEGCHIGALAMVYFSMKWLLTCSETITSPEVDFLSSVVLGLL